MTHLTRDLVCGELVDAADACHEIYNHRDFCFCSEGCRLQFMVTPERYLRRRKAFKD
jgi:YHS domain-containing protein